MSNFQCPLCQAYTTITSQNHYYAGYPVSNSEKSKYGSVGLWVEYSVCASETCKELMASVKIQPNIPSAHPIMIVPNSEPLVPKFRLYPQGNAKPWPDYVPKSIREDYKEACLIVSFSPKASATLSRRALQTMVKDRWGATGANLFQEISSIKDMVDPEIYAAIQAVREVGNVGAHMEKEIGMILEIEEGEAESLLELIEQLLHEWYIVRHQRQQNMKAITEKGRELKRAKDEAKPKK